VVYLMPDFSRTGATPFVTDNAGQPLPVNPFHDVRVRRALTMAINREAIAERVMEGQATATNQWLPPGVYSAVPDLRLPVVDVEAARRLLAEPASRRASASPCTRPMTASRMTAASPRRWAQFWTRIGVQTQVDALPWASFAARSNRQEFAIRLTSWGSVTAEAGYMLSNIMQSFDTARRTGASNSGRYSNPDFDRQIDAAVAIIDDNERERALQALIRRVTEDVPIIPLVQLNHSWATKRGLAYEARMDERTVAMGLKPA
jgi:peptide/nickel transport system substrate-binding protein